MSKEPSKVDQRRALGERKHAERMRREKALVNIVETAVAKTKEEMAVPPEVAEIVRAMIEEEIPHEERIAEIVEATRPKATKSTTAKAGARDKKKSLTVWLDPVLVKKLKAAAVEREKTIEEIVAKAIAVELARGSR